MFKTQFLLTLVLVMVIGLGGCGASPAATSAPDAPTEAPLLRVHLKRLSYVAQLRLLVAPLLSLSLRSCAKPSSRNIPASP